MITIDKLKQLRHETGISINECKKALEEAQGNVERAKEILKKWGKEFSKEKAEREVGQGIIEVYVHPNKKIGAIIELRCETDFVAKSEELKTLSHELCLQIASMDPKDRNSFLSQPWIRDESKNIKQLIDEYIAKLGENIVVKRFVRYEI